MAASGGIAAIAAAVFIASASRSAKGTTRATSPLRFRLADGAGQALAAAHAGANAQLDLWLAEFRGVAGDDEIRHHRHFAAAPQRKSIDGGDPRLAGGLDQMAAPARKEVAGIEIGGGFIGHFLDVGAGGKGLLAAAGQHRTALRRVGFKGGKGVATSAGGFIVLMPVVTLIALGVWKGSA